MIVIEIDEQIGGVHGATVPAPPKPIRRRVRGTLGVMPRATLPNAIEIEYDTFGSPSDPALLLVAGFTSQLISWDPDLCEMLASRGRYVIRYDNRDCGLSTHLDGITVDVERATEIFLFGHDEKIDCPYDLSDMAADGIGLLDHLGIDRAHIMGVSMGGMIVQAMAIDHPDRIASATSIMSTTGERDYGEPTAESLAVLLADPPADRQAYIDGAADYAVWASKAHFDLERARRFAAAAYDRAFYPEGSTRQMAAILTSGDRAEGLADLRVPMLVIHGTDDTLITPSGGERTAEITPGAELLMLDDMGHDLPVPLWPVIVDAVIAHSDRNP